MRNVKLILFVVVFVAGWLGGFSTAHAAVISSVVRHGTSTNDPPIIAPNPLAEDELSFVDRTHQYNEIPIELVGAEYIMVANNDKTQDDYWLTVKLSQPARLCLFLDNRLGHGPIPGGDPFLNPDLWAAGMDWVYLTGPGFVDTGLNIGIDENGNGIIDQWSSVYQMDAPAGVSIVLLKQNDPTDPAGRNMYGIAAGSIRISRFWIPYVPLDGDGGHFLVVDDPRWMSTPWGFYGGWQWFNDDGIWRQPFENPPLGGPDFWAFTDRMTFRYTDRRIRRVDRSCFFYYERGGGSANCLHLLADADGPYGPSRPLHPDFMANFEIKSHTFSVNAGKVQGQFEPMQFIETGQLETYVRQLGMTEADIQAFMDGDIFGQLRITDPLGEGYVGVEHAQWTHPEPALIYTVESLEITEGETVSYGVRLREEPNDTVTVKVVSSLPDDMEILGADSETQILQLHFDPQNWDKPQVVSIATKHLEGVWTGGLAHYLADDPNEGSVLSVTILDAKTGGRGYFAADINRDTHVNFYDVAEVAANWLESTRAGDGLPWIGPWQSQAIGTSGGSASYDDVNEVWTINGDGTDIGGTSDQFHYVYQQFEGDCQMTATILSLEPTDVWAKAGIMLRDSLDPGSPHAMIVVTPERGVAFQWRPEAGAETQSIHYGPAAHLKPPISLRLVFIGSKVEGYYYSNGEWVKQGEAMPCLCDVRRGYAGMVVTSHVESRLCTATFNNVISAIPINTP